MSPAKRPSPEPKVKHRVFLVDDHPPMRRGLALLIGQEPDLVVCGEAEDLGSAIDGIRDSKPEVVVVDLTLKDSSGLELIKSLKTRDPKLKVLVLSMHDENIFAERALRAGAKGYIMKEETTEGIVRAIHTVLAGEVYLSPRMSSKILRRVTGERTPYKDSELAGLSDRELEVFQRIGQGLTTRQIAEKLHLSIKTVESYREQLKNKLGLENASQLVQAAVKWAEGRS